MENDPRRRRSRGGRRRGGGGQERGKPTRTPAEPKPPPPARGLARRERPQRRRGMAPRSPDDLRPGLPCVIVMDCREGEPDRTGAAALFEGFFDLETGDLRRAGFGVPRLRIVRPGPASVAPVEPQAPERLWGFECWWRPDPANTGLTDTDRIEIEQSRKLLRGLMRDARRSARAALAR